MIELKSVEEVKIKTLVPVELASEKLNTTTKKDVRPAVLDAKVYKLKSSFVDYAIYITLSYKIDENGSKIPYEIFINSKDLTKSAEYAVLTRLISAVFRRSEDPTFIIEEFKSIYDPNGGHFKEGRYYPSIYSEIADILEKFFSDIGIMKKRERKGIKADAPAIEIGKSEVNLDLKICPKCGQKSLKVDNGCMSCMNADCGYSKCDE
jgi:ribonucleoside-diphosphate reductase alpha chain